MIRGIPGDGGVNDMISVQFALELGCRIKPSKCHQDSFGHETPLEVAEISRLKLRCMGHFGIAPHWIDVVVIVIHNLHLPSVYGRDMRLSWPTQCQLRTPNSNYLHQQRGLNSIVQWEMAEYANEDLRIYMDVCQLCF